MLTRTYGEKGKLWQCEEGCMGGNTVKGQWSRLVVLSRSRGGVMVGVVLL